jgi:glycolate dehydrogenase FAD-binding subunit
MLQPFAPDDAETAAAMLAHAAAGQVIVVPHGNRTKLRAPVDATRATTMSTMRLTRGLAHYAGDLVATAPAGCTLQDVNAALAAERQWIPLDPPFADRTTIGGMVASNDSGPRRHRFGSPRDLIIGIEVALTSGTVARSGGRVVKNVAGYDLGRLFCGSLGSLGLITSVTFKLAPLAQESRTVAARFDSAAAAGAAALELAANPALTPSALEIVSPAPCLLVRFESTRKSSEQMAATSVALLGTHCPDIQVLDRDTETALWREHQVSESPHDGLVAQVSVLPNAAGPTIDLVGRLAGEFAVRWSATCRAALGVLRVVGHGEPAALQRFAAGLRTALTVRHGYVQFVAGTEVLGDQIEPRGPVGAAAAVTLAVKQRFDPSGILPFPWARS